MIELLLAADLGLNLKLVAAAVVPVDRLSRIRRPEEVLDLCPLLAHDVELVLNWVCVHYVGQNSQFLVVIEVFERIR